MRRDALPNPMTSLATAPPVPSHGVSTGLLVAVAAMSMLIVAYWPTARSMVEIWARSDTFAHGFVVPLISAWLAWRHRALLAGANVRPSLSAMIPVAVAGFGWLLGELAEVNALRQFGFVALLALAVPAIAGIDVARRLAFPLAFLLFAVPFGEFLLPLFMDWTATFTVTALKASGVPVYREGLHFVIPSGSWSVVEACSGVRYLIASVMVGTLFAYLTFQSTTRRIAFIAVSFLVPVLANWLRAYMIVMVGHLSGNRLAVGVDHLIAGWLFFGVVMALTFGIGARWREDEPKWKATDIGEGVQAAANSGESTKALVIGASLFLAIALAPVLASRLLGGDATAAAPVLTKLGDFAGWTQSSTPTTTWRPRYLQPPAERFESFTSGGQNVGVYVAFYRNQSGMRKLISSENVLVASSDAQWLETAAGRRETHVPGGPDNVRTADLSHRAGERLRVWSWYWVDGRWTDSPIGAKALTALSQLSGHGDDSAVVILVTVEGTGPGAVAQADALLESFAGKAVGTIASMLQATKISR
jgi:exosortase A